MFKPILTMRANGIARIDCGANDSVILKRRWLESDGSLGKRITSEMGRLTALYEFQQSVNGGKV